MLVINGKYNQAVVYTSDLEESVHQQIVHLLEMPYVVNSRIRMMPDVHAGIGCAIGTTMTIQDKIVPNLVGVDIGCGMRTIQIKTRTINYHHLDEVIRLHIPSGFNVRKDLHENNGLIDLKKLRCLKNAHIDIQRASLSLGTLGGGNHFIEIGKDSEGLLYLIIHSGSRQLGLQVANYYQKKAYETMSSEDKKVIPKSLAYLQGHDMEDYVHDMMIVQKYALLNRKTMAEIIIKELKWQVGESFNTIHNYYNPETKILRKGAVSANAGEKLLIPMNMRDGSLICIGKGNDEWNYSAPHGAGRIMSRKEAKQKLSMKAYEETMRHVYSTSINKKTLDEAPMAYKSMDEIKDKIADTAEILDILKPIYNFKAV